MRNTLEDLYYGNITPGTQQIAPNSELKRATDRVARFESQLTERLDKDGQAILAKLLESLDEADSITALENFILGFRLGAKITMECMDEVIVGKCVGLGSYLIYGVLIAFGALIS